MSRLDPEDGGAVAGAAGRVPGATVAVGGLFVVLAALPPWASLEIRGEFFEERFDHVFTAPGVAHRTGVVALLAGGAIFVAGVGMAIRSTSARGLAMLATVGAAAAVVAAGLGLLQTEAIVGNDPEARGLAQDFGFDGETPVEDFVENWSRTVRMAEAEGGPVRLPFQVATDAGLGPYVALAGGLVAGVGAVIAARRAVRAA